jgi:hypothetical protein
LFLWLIFSRVQLGCHLKKIVRAFSAYALGLVFLVRTRVAFAVWVYCSVSEFVSHPHGEFIPAAPLLTSLLPYACSRLLWRVSHTTPSVHLPFLRASPPHSTPPSISLCPDSSPHKPFGDRRLRVVRFFEDVVVTEETPSPPAWR